MKRFLTLALCAALLAGSPAAGVAATGRGSPPSAAVSSPAQPSAEALEAAREMMVALHFESQMDLMMRAMFTPIIDAEMRHYPNLTPAQRGAMTEAALDGMRAIMPEFMEIAAGIYARSFTVDEMHAIRDFYSSGPGQAVLSRMPSVGQQAAAAVQPLIPRMQEEMLNSLCRRLDCGEMQRSRVS